MRQFDLADTVEIDVFGAVELGKNCGSFPIRIRILPPDKRLRSVARLRNGLRLAGKDKQKQRPIAAQRDAPEHSARTVVHQIDIVFPPTVAVDLERRHDMTQLLLELLL